jgi:hypothetical protein
MRLVLHPKVYSDIDEIMRYYESVATPELAEVCFSRLFLFFACPFAARRAVGLAKADLFCSH